MADPVTVAISLALSVGLSIAANLLRGPIKQEGPRLDDLSPTGVQPGAIIPRCHGHTIAPGTVIAQTRIAEDAHTTKTGGKGGPTVKSTTFSYRVPAVAVAFSTLEIGGIVKIKANEKIIFEITEEEGLVYSDFEEIEIFTGTEDQAPSGILEAEEGVGKVPAYRGTAYFVLKNLQLANLGNRLPVFRIETAGEFETTFDVDTGPDTGTDDPTRFWFFIDYNRRRLYSPTLGGAGYGPRTELLEYNLDTLAEIDQHDLTTGPAHMGGAAEFKGLDQVTGYLIGSHQISGPAWSEYIYDPATKTWPVDRNETTFLSSVSDFNTQHYPVIRSADSSQVAFLSTDFHSDNSTRNQIHDASDMTFIARAEGPEPTATEGSPVRPKWMTGSFNARHGSDTAWACWVSFDNIQFRSYRLTNAGAIVTTTYTNIHRTEFHASDSFTKLDLKWTPFIDKDGTITIFLQMGVPDGAVNRRVLFKWSPASEAILWFNLLTVADEPDMVESTRQLMRPDGKRLLWFNGADVREVDLASGVITNTSEVDPYEIDIVEGAFWDDKSGCLYTVFTNGTTFDVFRRFCWLTTIDPASTTIGAILRTTATNWVPDVSPLLEADHFEIHPDLDAMVVAGATFTQLLSVRDVADKCAFWKPIIFFEGGDRIKFSPRDGTAVATIRAQDMGQRARDEAPKSAVSTSRQDDVQLPREIRIRFVNSNRAMSVDAAYARITRSRSNLVQDIQLPFTGVPEEAKFAAWTTIGEAYAARRAYSVSLPFRYFVLEPGDVVNIPDNEGNLGTGRIVQVEDGANFVIEMKAQDQVNSYDDVTFSAETGVSGGVTLIRPEHSITQVMDLPRLTDDPVVDDGLQIYIGLGASFVGWHGGSIYKDTFSASPAEAFGGDFSGSTETNFEEIDTVDISLASGTITTAPSGAVNEYITDTISVMRVTFDTINPVFTTLTDLQFEIGFDNIFAVGNNVDGWEIIQAQVATQISPQVYDFSILHRGIRGTEWAIGQATAGDTVAHLTSPPLRRDAFTTGQIGETVTYRGVTIGMDVTSAPDFDLIIVGRGLIPFAPGLGEVYRDGSGNITGTLEARAQQADSAGLYNVPGADFEIDIYDGPFGTSPPPSFLRLITLTDTDAFSYTAAQQTTDFGGTQTAVNAEIFQLDSAGIRGYGRQVVI